MSNIRRLKIGRLSNTQPRVNIAKYLVTKLQNFFFFVADAPGK
jgi:hypothetical protein